MSHMRIYESYFLGNVNVAMQDTSELSSGATCTAPGTHVQTRGGIGCGMPCLLCAQLGWKPVSYRPVLAPEQMVGLWPCINLVKLKEELDHQGREPFKKVRGEKEQETSFNMAIWKKVK